MCSNTQWFIPSFIKLKALLTWPYGKEKKKNTCQHFSTVFLIIKISTLQETDCRCWLFYRGCVYVCYIVIEITCCITNWLFLYLFQKHEELWYLWAPDIQTCGQQINFIHPHWPFSISKRFIRLALLSNHFIISKHFLIIFFLTSSNFIVVYAFFHFEHFSF